MSRHKTKEQIKQEEEVIRNAQHNPRYFGALYEQYFEDVFLFVFRRVMAKELAADITSMVFYKAITHIKRYKFKGVPFSAWLFRIASNEVNLYFRKTKKQRHVSLESAGAQKLSEEVKELSGDDPVHHLAGVLNELKPDEVELLELRFFEGHSFKEISVIVGITENNAKVRMHRLLGKLKTILKEKLPNV